jgi:trk system potassium uptake protein TrkA
VKHTVLVIGLGRFGSAAARELMALGHEVLAVDANEDVVNGIASEVTRAVVLDSTDAAALRALGAGDFEHAIVGISVNIEASIITTMLLKQMGVRNVIAKAASDLHASILERVGADRTIQPEREMGERIAHSFHAPAVMDFLDIGPRFGVLTIRPPASLVGRRLDETGLPERLGLTVIALRRGDEVIVNPDDGEVVQADDQLTLIGWDDRLDELAPGG